MVPKILFESDLKKKPTELEGNLLLHIHQFVLEPFAIDCINFLIN